MTGSSARPPVDDDAPTDPGPLVTAAEVDEDAPTDLAPGARPPTLPDLPWAGLHPASLLVNLVPQAWRTARGAWPLLLALFVGGEGAGLNAVEGIVVLTFFGLTLARTLVHWATLRYRLSGGRLEITSGLLHRTARAIDPVRIQNVELVTNVFHKLTGLVEVRIETAGDASTEGLLSALSARDAAVLRDRLRGLAGRAPARDEGGETLVSLGVLEILAYGFSRRTVGVVAVLTAVAMELIGRFGADDPSRVAWALRPTVVVAAILLGFAGSWLFSAGTALLRHHRYRLRRDGEHLATEEGLTTRRRVEIPVGKVQIVRVDEPALRRAMGYGTVLVETAGLGIADGRVRQAEGVVPMVERGALAGVVAAAVPDVGVDPFAAALLPPHPRALYRAVVARVVRASILAGLLALVVGPWGWVAVAMIPGGLPLAWLDWKRQGWLVTPRAIVARRGWWTRHTWVIARDKLQSVHVHQSLAMRWHGLGSVAVRVAGTEVRLPDIGIDAALGLLDELSPAARARR